MNAVALFLSRGVIPHIDESGNLALDLSRVPHDQRAEVVALAKRRKAEIINELTVGPSGLPDRTDWQCPAHARHRDFWVSDFGLRICATFHPDPRVLRAAWLASKDGAQ